MRFLFIDRIVRCIPGELAYGLKHITRDDPYLHQDESGNTCFASSLIGESLGQLAAWSAIAAHDFNYRPVAGIVASACLHRPAYLGDTLLLESFIDALDTTSVQYHSIARVGREVIFTIEGALGPLLPMAKFISDEEIRRQFAEINRPGDWTIINQLPIQQYATPYLPSLQSHTPMLFDLLFDRILDSNPGVSITAEKRISRSAPYFPDHFPYNPVLPMTILLECKLNLAHLFLKQAKFPNQYQIKELRKIKMNEFIHPGDIVRCEAHVLRQDAEQLILRYLSEVNAKRVCVLDLIMTSKSSLHE